MPQGEKAETDTMWLHKLQLPSETRPERKLREIFFNNAGAVTQQRCWNLSAPKRRHIQWKVCTYHPTPNQISSQQSWANHQHRKESEIATSVVTHFLELYSFLCIPLGHSVTANVIMQHWGVGQWSRRCYISKLICCYILLSLDQLTGPQRCPQ